MLMARMMVAALAAVGLSVGGFELGVSRMTSSNNTSAPLVDVPADHPLAVALQGPVAQTLPARDRQKLIDLSIDLKRDQEDARAAATAQASKASYALQIDGSGNPPQKATDGTKLAELEAKLAEWKTKYSVQSVRVRSLQSQVDVERERLRVLQSPSSGTEATARLALQSAYAKARLLSVHQDLEKQLIQQKEDAVYKKYSDIVLQQMTPKISEQVKGVVKARRDMDEEKGFGLLIALRSRDELKLTPQQVTKLQLLQADFIRRFAPIREAYETRVDNLKWNYVDSTVVGAPAGTLQITPAKPNSKVEFKTEYFVETKNAKNAKGTKKQAPTLRFYVVEPMVKANEKVVDLRLWSYPGKEEPKAKTKNTVVRYFVWTSDESLQGQLKSLKSEIDAKAKAVLSDDQRQQLQEKIDQSLAAGK